MLTQTLAESFARAGSFMLAEYIARVGALC